MNPIDSRPEDAEAGRVWLSELVDGRAEACQPAVAAWSRDPEARRTWHTYQLIGDVLRSDDLAAPAAHDEAFLQRFRARLAQEPVILAPMPASGREARSGVAAGSRRLGLGWGAAAALAGVALVGGAVFSLQRGSEVQLSSSVGAQREPAPVAVSTTAQTPAQAPGIRVTTLPSTATPSAPAADATAQHWYMLDERVLRDAKLESYLRAHRGSAAVGGRVEPVTLGR